MRDITAVIIGAGHAGLAMSARLSERSIDHVVLERGEVANSWRTERWDSLRLLTPNWQSRLPGYEYRGNDPDGYRTIPQVVDFIQAYADTIAAPVQTDTTVNTVTPSDTGYRIETGRGDWQCRAVVVASGACNRANIPAVAEGVPQSVAMLSSLDYRNPEQLAEGGVMVVGASATGTQIAREVQRSGRPVTLCIGEHIRVPRMYRDRDIKWWMDAAGIMDERYDEIEDINRARSVPSLQLAGSDDRSTLDINTLSQMGVKLTGRFAGINDGKALFSGSLRNQCALSDLKMNRLLNTIDEWAEENDLDSQVPPPDRFEATWVSDDPPIGIDLTSGQIKTIIWATGYHPDYSWLQVPVFDRKGRIRHDGGNVDAPGLYLMGLQFLRRRKSSLIDGAADDSRDLANHMQAYLAKCGTQKDPGSARGPTSRIGA